MGCSLGKAFLLWLVRVEKHVVGYCRTRFLCLRLVRPVAREGRDSPWALALCIGALVGLFLLPSKPDGVSELYLGHEISQPREMRPNRQAGRLAACKLGDANSLAQSGRGDFRAVPGGDQVSVRRPLFGDSSANLCCGVLCRYRCTNPCVSALPCSITWMGSPARNSMPT